MKQTRERFPRTIRSVEELPAPAAEVVRQHQLAGTILRMVLIPRGSYPLRRTAWGFTLPFGWRQTPERTLIFGEDALTVIEVEQGGVSAVTTIPLAALVEIHFFLVLLYAWIEFTWEESAAIKTLKVEFHSMGERMIWPGLDHIMETFRPQTLHAPGRLLTNSTSSFPLKFRNYIRDSVPVKDTLAAAVYQPAIRSDSGLWHPFISPNRAIAVTERTIIVLEDQRDRYRRDAVSEADYTVSRRFYPLERLQSVRVESGPDADRLCVGFRAGDGSYDLTLPLLPPDAQHLCDLLSAQIARAAV